MTVIELGDVSRVPAESPEPEPAPEFQRGTVRRLVLIGLTLLCAVLLSASLPPGPAGFRRLWSVPFGQTDTMAIRGDLAFVHRARPGGAELTAYDLATGAVRWVRVTGGDVTWLSGGQSEEVLLIPGNEQTVEVEYEDGSRGVEIYGGTVTALDPATGTPLWKHPGFQEWADTNGTVLLYEYDRDGLAAVRVVRARDGDLAWERRLEDAQTAMLQADGTDPAHVVLIAPDGGTTVLRYADGATVVNRRLPWTPMRPSTNRGSSLFTATGLVLVAENLAEHHARVTAYRVGTLERLWERESDENPYVQDCGPVLCLVAGTDIIALDPATGTERWRRPGQVNVGVLPGDRMLVSDGADNAQQTILRAVDGRVLGSGGRGTVIHHNRRDGSMLLSRTLPPDYNRAVLRRLDLSTGRSVVLGVIPISQDGFCDGDGRYIGCRDGDDLTFTAVG
ncbi:outer membrane protein assembly factor BamB family protein [Actinoplanes flavus]|uniref:PQQ-like beta-propeller repeat protein n=1 Tax=Actinoplanes flavus TaxID=2820290 RepID=A0ABS3UC75_9ACTN|nr:PQQ-binding-like beta-propeller repeat protein [Actinoplanes flavus]MBO3736379.1 PQQ-like beta-propeller repeat protein [Actinoplanes flavus]